MNPRPLGRGARQVDLVKATPHDVMYSKEKDSIGGQDDLQASHIDNLKWMANAPHFKQIAIGEDGLPVPIICPDPRAFALYKIWMGTQDPTRDPDKKRRDIKQAQVVASIIHEYLPHYPFLPEHLTYFSKLSIDIGIQHNLFKI